MSGRDIYDLSFCKDDSSCTVTELKAIDIKYNVNKEVLKIYIGLLKKKGDVSEIHQYYPEVVNYFNALCYYYSGKYDSITDEQLYEKILEHIK